MQMPRVDGYGVSFRLEGRHTVTRANQDIDTRLSRRERDRITVLNKFTELEVFHCFGETTP